MKIHAFGSESHYRDHVDAVWRHLPDALRGTWYPKATDVPRADPDDIFMVAGFPDVEHVPNHRIIYIEHGAGQRYVGLKEHHGRYYHGSNHPNRVVAYISPRQEVADSWGRPAFAAGSPICDPYELYGEEGVVAITFHWDAPNVCPEARSALPHYADRMADIIAALKRQGYEVLGHRHPKLRKLDWAEWGVPEVDVETVRRRASILIADNTSLMYEMSYLLRHVIALDAPWYRPDVEHGLRFWGWYGPMVDGPESLLAHLEGPPWYPCIDGPTDAEQAYGKRFSDGNDGMRAASWLTARFA